MCLLMEAAKGLEDLNLKEGLVITEDYENVEYY